MLKQLLVSVSVAAVCSSGVAAISVETMKKPPAEPVAAKSSNVGIASEASLSRQSDIAPATAPLAAKPLPAGTVAAPVSQAATYPVSNSSLTPPSVTSAVATKSWDVRVEDVNFAGTFTRWAKTAGWQLRWDARKHVLVDAPDTISGSFEDAIRAVLSSPGIAEGAYPLEVCYYPNNPPLARVTRKGEQSKECN